MSPTDQSIIASRPKRSPNRRFEAQLRLKQGERAV